MLGQDNLDIIQKAIVKAVCRRTLIDRIAKNVLQVSVLNEMVDELTKVNSVLAETCFEKSIILLRILIK